MPGSLTIREGRPSEAPFLSELAVRSKAYWGYPDEFMESCRAELAVDPALFSKDDIRCYVATDDDLILGFYSLGPLSEAAMELDGLFVEPGRIGHGVGRSLVQHATSVAAGRGARRLLIQGDPNATRFYHAAGARQIGVRESGSIAGRMLPLFEISLSRGETEP